MYTCCRPTCPVARRPRQHRNRSGSPPLRCQGAAVAVAVSATVGVAAGAAAAGTVETGGIERMWVVALGTAAAAAGASGRQSWEHCGVDARSPDSAASCLASAQSANLV